MQHTIYIMYSLSLSLQDWPTNKLRLMCESAYVLPRSPEAMPTFERAEEYKEVVLVQGEVHCPNTMETLSAPAILPGNIRYAHIHTLDSQYNKFATTHNYSIQFLLLAAKVYSHSPGPWK